MGNLLGKCITPVNGGEKRQVEVKMVLLGEHQCGKSHLIEKNLPRNDGFQGTRHIKV